MPTRTINRGRHTYRIETIALNGGLHTFEIVHTERAGNVTRETHHQPGIAYATQEIAMENGLFVANEMAEQVKD
ncbi:hypothetical protein [Paraburkholderia sp. EG304]|uniref:hypothetical protein n=1 Tax=Paraburkholderia sp. EG304 TaxID=3237015 RepID=UPI00397A1369